MVGVMSPDGSSTPLDRKRRGTAALDMRLAEFPSFWIEAAWFAPSRGPSASTYWKRPQKRV